MNQSRDHCHVELGIIIQVNTDVLDMECVI